MNWLDITIVILLAIALWQGWRQGVVTQTLGLAAIVLGIWAGWRYGAQIGAWVGLEAGAARVAGFVAVLVVAIVAAVLTGRATRGLFRIAGLGMVDSLLGALFSALKMVIVVRLLVAVLSAVDPAGRVLPRGAVDGSAVYGAVERTTDAVIPLIKSTFERL